MTRIIYCKNHKRRPIQIGPIPAQRDVQADIPHAWCDVCGCEVFEPQHHRCLWCRSRKGENE